MAPEPDPLARGPAPRGGRDGSGAGQVAFRLVEPPPQQIGDDQAENSIAKKFEPLIAAVRGSRRAAALPVVGQRARMGQCLRKQFRPSKSWPMNPARASAANSGARPLPRQSLN